MSDLTKFEIERTVEILVNDVELTEAFTNNGISLSDTQYWDLATLLLENQSHISDNSIDDLNSEEPSFLRIEIVEILNLDYMEFSLYKQILYSFKYSTVKSFFRENYERFIPEYDFLNIQSQEKLKIFQEAFMQEYDRLASIIDDIYNVVDINKVPERYLTYLAHIIGYERQDRELLADVSFRELIKNMVEVYKIKGTNFSFELFFNFLGFEVDLKEYWFDKRFADKNLSANPYTAESNRNNYLFYLTPVKPTEYIPEGMESPYTVKENDIIETLDLHLFDDYSGETYSPLQLVGILSGYPGTPYTFFKTNIIQYSLTAIQSTSEISEEETALTSEQQQSIKKYADFLTPIFIQKNIIIHIPPYEENMDSVFIKDIDRPDPRSPNPLNNDADDSTYANDETMFHFYAGRQPSTYYWEDGVRFYNDPLPAPITESERWTIKDGSFGPAFIEPGGMFIGGIFNDDFEGNIYDRNDPALDSIYYQLKEAYSTWTEQEILEEISRLISTGDIFAYYKNFYIIQAANPTWTEAQVITELETQIANETIFPAKNIFPREVMYPLIDYPDVQNFEIPALTDFSVGTPQKLSYSTGALRQIFNSGQKRRVTYEEEPFEYNDVHNKVNIISIDANSKYSSASLKTDLKVCFPSDLNFGKSVYDISGNQNDGLMNGAIWSNVEGKNAIYFDGSGYVAIPSYTTNPQNNAFAISLRFRSNSIPVLDSYRIMSKTTSSVIANTNGVQIVSNSDGTVSAYVGNGTSVLSISVSELLDNNWHLLILNLNGIVGELFVDNVSEGTFDYNAFPIINNSPWALGAVFDPAASPSISNNFIGYIKDVAIWEKSLTSSDRNELFLNELEVPTSTIVTLDNDQRFNHFEITEDTSEKSYIGTFAVGSNVITGVEYNYSLAPIWIAKTFVLDELARNNLIPTDIYKCIIPFNAVLEGDTDLLDSPSNWRKIRGIDSLEIGQKIYSPHSLFGAEILKINKFDKEIHLSKKSTQVITDQQIIFIGNLNGLVELGGLSRISDNNVFKVLSQTSNTSLISPYGTETTFTLDAPLQENLSDTKGYLKNFFKPSILKNFRYPFLWNYFELEERYNVYKGLGSIFTLGTAVVDWFIQFTHVGVGSILTSGAALIEWFLTYPFTASGGGIFSGSATIASIFNFLSSGLAQVSGSAILSLIYNFLSSGSIVINGTALTDYFLSFRHTGIGEIIINGSATAGITAYRFEGIGGAEASGDAIYNVEFDFIASGGAITSGSAIVNINAIRVRGTAPYSIIYIYEATGGCLTSGEAVSYSMREDAIRVSGNAEINSWSF